MTGSRDGFWVQTGQVDIESYKFDAELNEYSASNFQHEIAEVVAENSRTGGDCRLTWWRRAAGVSAVDGRRKF